MYKIIVIEKTSKNGEKILQAFVQLGGTRVTAGILSHNTARCNSPYLYQYLNDIAEQVFYQDRLKPLTAELRGF